VSKHPVLLYQTFLFLQITYQLSACVSNPASETFFDTVITGCPLRELHRRLREVLTPCSNIKKGEGGVWYYGLWLRWEKSAQRLVLQAVATTCNTEMRLAWYTRVNKNPSAWNFLSPKTEVTCGTVAIIIRVVSLSPYLRIRAVSLSSIHYNQPHRVYINRRRQYICLIWN